MANLRNYVIPEDALEGEDRAKILVNFTPLLEKSRAEGCLSQVNRHARKQTR